MSNEPNRPQAPNNFTRRTWLSGLLAGGLAIRAGADDSGKADVATALDEVRKRAKDVGIGPLRTESVGNYVAIGNAKDAFRSDALRLCEDLAEDYLKHFQAKGFAVAKPKTRLILVALADATEFAGFLGESPGPDVTGVYDVDTNRLAFFDNRAPGVANAGRANTVTLMHEATHQLTFNTGLLDREADVPMCVSEGLACYGETRQPRAQKKVGAENSLRLASLSRDRGGWKLLHSVEALLKDDELLTGPDAAIAYAESWLLVSYFLRTKARADMFRRYLDAIRARRDASKRIEDALANLGNLEKLDRELARYSPK